MSHITLIHSDNRLLHTSSESSPGAAAQVQNLSEEERNERVATGGGSLGGADLVFWLSAGVLVPRVNIYSSNLVLYSPFCAAL